MGELVVNGLAASRGYEKINAALRDIIERAAALSPYDVEVFAGVRYGKAEGSRHNTANAVDIVLRDAGGRLIPNYQSETGFAIYEGFAILARQIQEEHYPELGNQFRWGGYFGGGAEKYGAVDLMHFDLKPGAAMDGGSFEEGLKPEQSEITKKMGAGLRSSATEKLVPADPYQKYENLWQPAYRRELSDGLEPSAPRPRPNPFLQPGQGRVPTEASLAVVSRSMKQPVGDANIDASDHALPEVPRSAESMSEQEFGVRFLGGDSPNREAGGDKLSVTPRLQLDARNRKSVFDPSVSIPGTFGTPGSETPPILPGTKTLQPGSPRDGDPADRMQPKTGLKYYIPIPRPNPLANRRGALAPAVPRDQHTASRFQDSAALDEYIMSAARAIVEEKRSRRGVRRSQLGLFGLPKPTSAIG